MIEVSNKYITKPGQLDPKYFTHDDGIGCVTDNVYYIHDSIVDFSALDLDEQDEACAFTWGGHGTIERCLIRGAGKLFMLGSGDKDHRPLEIGRRVIVRDSILEDFGRRGPEVKCGMTCEMTRCLVKHWARPDRFTVRSFGAWAYDGGIINAMNCIFIPYEKDEIPFCQRVKDCANWIGEMVRLDGLKALLNPKTYIPGRRRALVATGNGSVMANQCAFVGDCYTDSNDDPMTEYEAEVLYESLERMREALEEKLL